MDLVRPPLYIVYPPLTQHDGFPTREIAAFPDPPPRTDSGAIWKSSHDKASRSQNLRICNPVYQGVVPGILPPERPAGTEPAQDRPRGTAEMRSLRKCAFDGKSAWGSNVPGVAPACRFSVLTRML